MNSQMLQALLTPRRRGIASLRNHPPGGAGTLADPGTASPLGPTIPMRIGATLNPMLERVQDIFPKDNPYGSFIERLIVGDSPERTRNMKEGYPHQYTGAGPNDPIIRPQIVDLAGALPIGSAATLAKAAAPLAVPAAMATGAAALNRLKAPGYAATSTDDLGAALLGQRLQHTGALDDAMVTYQGSPHKFDALDPAKIGTGEGVQAFGHGLYVAENPRIAKGYQERLAKGTTPTLRDVLHPEIGKDISQEAYSFLKGYEDIDGAIEGLRATANSDSPMIAKSWAGREDELAQLNRKYLDAADWIENNKQRIQLKIDEGYLYEIDVPDEDIAKMLDWDKPLSAQTESVRKALDRLQAHADLPRGFGPAIKAARQRPRFDGNDLYAEMVKILPAEKISAMFDELGIPGIKYYDQGSRGAEEGTRNMVLFDDLARRAKVLKRNDETIAQPSVDEFIGKLLED